ncbi:lysylphosphatidylglycerol synthase domain-containing protein [Rubrobacter taiwanensis]|uniref:lysylphosphatidylglycerol synthase domain-containing protein n=1 Tax=Rubrobacter taiwanensis TaxID=185139 RepID=UPI001404CBD3|nr:lysylphosphatidylglycerol synthase domain-containing protein [Rubrobacter taiwanensis]
MNPKLLSRLRKLAGPLLILLAALFLGRAIVAGWEEAREYDWRFNAFYLALSVGLLFAYYAQQWGGWRLIMQNFGDPLSQGESGRIWFASILGRYVPGNVAMVAGRIALCRRRGIPGRVTFASMVYENALILISALLFAAATVPFWPEFEYKGYALALAALAPVGLALLHPAIFGRAANLGLRKLGREPLEATLPFGRVLLLTLYYTGGWALLGLAFAALAASVAPVGLSEIALLAGGYAFAWEVGFLAFVTPSGLGVKEVALYAVLALVFPAPVAAALVAASRLWQTLAELTAAALVWLSRPAAARIFRRAPRGPG